MSNDVEYGAPIGTSSDRRSVVRRLGSVLELPDENLRCMAFGHAWSDPPVTDAPGWGTAAWEIRLSCPCGRWRRDVVRADSMELIYRDYGGGILLELAASVTRQEARGEWIRRQYRRRKARRD